MLTGITEAMLLPAPRIDEVLPPLLEFIGGAVIVGHNIRFDISFLDAALTAHGYPKLEQRRVDTIGLARRLVRDEVPDLKLGTLARHLRVSVSPCHRAYADAAATAEVLHALLERAGTFGVLGLDDLLALPSIRAHPSASKLRLTARLPRRPGVYLMKDRGGRILYVGKATNLRARVRSYFGGDDRKKVPQLLRETEAIDWIECPHELEASVRELRLIQELEPRFNRQGKRWRSTAYVKLTLAERFPRLTVVRTVKDDGNLYLGPFASTRAAHTVREAIETAAPLRRCTVRTGRTKAIVRRRAVRARAARRRVLPVPRATPPRPTTPRSSRPCGAASPRTRACCSSRSSGACTRSPTQERFEEAAITRDRARRAHARAAPAPDARVAVDERADGRSRSTTASSPSSTVGCCSATRARPARASGCGHRRSTHRRSPPISIAGGPTSCSSWRAGSTARSVPGGPACSRRRARRAHRVRVRSPATSRSPRRGIRRGR